MPRWRHPIAIRRRRKVYEEISALLGEWDGFELVNVCKHIQIPARVNTPIPALG